jgi:hypothetical protein
MGDLSHRVGLTVPETKPQNNQIGGVLSIFFGQEKIIFGIKINIKSDK